MYKKFDFSIDPVWDEKMRKARERLEVEMKIWRRFGYEGRPDFAQQAKGERQAWATG